MISEVTNEDCQIMMGRYPDKKKYVLSERQIMRKSETARIRYQRNKEKEKARAIAYRLRNPEKYKAQRNLYRTKDPRGIYDVIKQSAKRRGLSLLITQSEFVSWYTSQERICIYCKRSEIDILKDTDIIQMIAQRLSIDRLENGKGYFVDNMGLCCRRCNTIKGNFFTKDEMMIIGKIINQKYASK